MNQQYLGISNSEQLQLATDIDTYLASGREVRSQDLVNGVIDYSLKCLNGSHKNKFIYINMTEDGEIIGSKPSERVTLSIENSGLDNEHFQILYREGIYYLKDLNSSSGTWLKFNNLPLFKIEDKTEIHLEGDIFTFEYGEPLLDPLFEYVRLFGLERFYTQFVNAGLDSIDKLGNIDMQSVHLMRSIVGPNNSELFTEMCRSKGRILSNNFVDRKIIVKGKTRKLYSERDWMMFSLGNSSDSTINVTSYEDLDSERPNNLFNYLYEVQIIYQHGSYWLMTNKNYKEPDLYIRIWPEAGLTEIRADDVIKAGKIDFKVSRFNVGKIEHKGSSDLLVERSYICQDLGINPKLDISLFCLFDGHDKSPSCVRSISEGLPQLIKEKLQDSEENSLSPDSQNRLLTHLKSILDKSCFEADQTFLKTRITNISDKDYNSGCTGLILLIFGDLIICANVGDSKAILSRCKKAVRLSIDHTIHQESELRRIQELSGRVDSELIEAIPGGVTRSFGRMQFKISKGEGAGHNYSQPLVSSFPDIRHCSLDFVTDDFIVIGSDGLFATLTSQQVIDFVYDKLAEMPITCQDPQKVAEELVLFSVERNRAQGADVGNVSALIICLNRGVNIGDYSPSRYSDISARRQAK